MFIRNNELPFTKLLETLPQRAGKGSRDQAKARGAHVEGDPRAGIARGMRQEGRGGSGRVGVEVARAAARTVRGGFAETLTYTEFPPERWRRTRTDNGIERINREIRRRKSVVATFPNGNSVPMLVTAGLKYIVVHDWDKRRCLDMSKLEELDELKEKAEG